MNKCEADEVLTTKKPVPQIMGGQPRYCWFRHDYPVRFPEHEVGRLPEWVWDAVRGGEHSHATTAAFRNPLEAMMVMREAVARWRKENGHL